MFYSPYAHMIRRHAFPLRHMRAYEALGESQVNIPIDVQAAEDAFVITALIPGAVSEEVSINVEEDILTIQGEIRDHRQDADTYLLRERPTGRFTRRLHLPAALDAGKAEATFSDGVLTLNIPRAENARPRTIQINQK